MKEPNPDRPIILLDLQYTLVANSKEAPFPFEAWALPGERYREWLVDLMRPEYVCLITIRGEEFREGSLRSIAEKTGWQPEEAYFSPFIQRAPQHKNRILVEDIFPRHGRERDYLALESNDATQAMYQALGIRAIRVPNESQRPWRELPVHLLSKSLF